MGRSTEVEDGEHMNLHVSKEQKEQIKKIACRDHGGNISKTGRIMADEYIKNHSAGNDSFKLDEWNEDPDFQGWPSLMQDWKKWYEALTTANKTDFFKALHRINEIRTQAISIMESRKLKNG